MLGTQWGGRDDTGLNKWITDECPGDPKSWTAYVSVSICDGLILFGQLMWTEVKSAYLISMEQNVYFSNDRMCGLVMIENWINNNISSPVLSHSWRTIWETLVREMCFVKTFSFKR